MLSATNIYGGRSLIGKLLVYSPTVWHHLLTMLQAQGIRQGIFIPRGFRRGGIDRRQDAPIRFGRRGIEGMSNIPSICSSPPLTCRTLAFRIHKIVPSTPPHTRNREEKDTHYNHRTGIGARIHIPRPFLNSPKGVLKDRVQPASP